MASFLVAVVPLVLILSQAGAYWLIARTWVEVRSMPRTVARLYRTLRVLDVLVPLAAGVYIAVLVGLSYPWAKWFTQVGQLRTPRLVQDLRDVDNATP